MIWIFLAALLGPSGGDDVTTTVHTDDELTRADLIEAIGHLNRTAMDMRRKGYTGTASDAYTRQHARIDQMLDTLDTLDTLPA